MAFVYRLDPELKIFYQLIYGHCTFHDLFSVSLKPELNPAKRPRVKFIIDNLLGDLETDEAGMQFFVNSMRDLKRSGFDLEPTAFLTTWKGTALFIQTLELLVDDTDGIHQVFPTLDAALVWLDETEKAQAIYQLRDELLEEARSQ